MTYLEVVEKNPHYSIRYDCLYNNYIEDAVEYLKDDSEYMLGETESGVSYFKTGARSCTIHGRTKMVSFYDNEGRNIMRVKCDNPEKWNDLWIYALKYGVLSVNFNENGEKIYQFTTYNTRKTICDKSLYLLKLSVDKYEILKNQVAEIEDTKEM